MFSPLLVIQRTPQRSRLSVPSKLCYAIGGAPYQITGSALGFFLQIYLLDVAQVIDKSYTNVTKDTLWDFIRQSQSDFHDFLCIFDSLTKKTFCITRQLPFQTKLICEFCNTVVKLFPYLCIFLVATHTDKLQGWSLCSLFSAKYQFNSLHPAVASQAH